MSKENKVQTLIKNAENKKKEIKDLQAELEQLIKLGINNTISSKNYEADEENNARITFQEPSQIDMNYKESSKKHSALKNVTIRSQVLNQPDTKNQIRACIKEETTKRLCGYDKEKVREYIRKQREKRLKQNKDSVKSTCISTDLKKQRLKELHQKALELVTKNVRHKRERSKSQENIRNTDDVEKYKIQRKTSTSSLVPDLIASNINICTQKHLQVSNITVRSRSRSNFPKPNLKPPSIIVIEQNNLITKNEREIDDVCLVKQNEINPAEQMLKKDVENEQNKAALKIQVAWHKYKQNVLKNNIKKSKLTRPAEINSNETPYWLQPSTVIPYPFNFISTVKRKLQLAVNSEYNKNYVDVGVQNNSTSSNSKLEKLLIGPQSNIKNFTEKKIIFSQSSDLKSFLSHKCLNLEQCKPVCDEKSSVKKSISSKTHSENDHSSDSDTSKNIPNISTESATDLRRNKPDDSEPKEKLVLNTDKLKHLKLRDYNLSNQNVHGAKDIEKSNHKTKIVCEPALKLNKNILELVSSECVSSKFKEKTKNLILIDPSIEVLYSRNTFVKDSQKFTKEISGNDTIISFNRSDYSKNISQKGKNSETETTDVSTDQVIKTLNANSKHSTSAETDYNHTRSNYSKPLKSECNPNSKSITEMQIHSEIVCTDGIINTMNAKSKLSTSAESEDKTNSNNVKILKSSCNLNSKIIPETQIHSEINTISSKERSYSSAFANISSTSCSVNKPPSASEISSRTLKTVKNRSAEKLNLTNQSDTDNLKKRNAVLINKQCNEKISVVPVQNVMLKTGNKVTHESQNNSNQIHLKFEAQLHLLNNFNESFNNLLNVEKTKSRQSLNNKDTQTSLQTKSDSAVSTHQETITETDNKYSKVSTEKQISSVNYSGGFGDVFDKTYSSIISSEMKTSDLSLTGLEISKIKDTPDEKVVEESSFINQQIKTNPHIKLSLDMFEQLIKDEDTRIENLKTILKIREKALLDRTRSELAWLEVQKKELKFSGQLHEIPLLKKRQRGIIIKLQHEQLEMQRLKQAQKAASKERKTILKEQRNMIKAQLSTNEMLSKIKLNIPRERRNSGPFKVYNIQSNESIRSETSISRKSSENEEIVNVKTQSVISCITEREVSADGDHEKKDFVRKNDTSFKTELAKKTLLMREAQLQKRRKAAEDLLKWHQMLLEEEKKVAELEMAASSIITRTSHCENLVSNEGSKMFRGSHLNSVWHNMTGQDNETCSMSDVAAEKFCLETNNVLSKNSAVESNISEKIHTSLDLSADNLNDESGKTEMQSINKQHLINPQYNSLKNSLLNNKSNSSIKEEISNTIKKQSTTLSTVSYTSEFEVSNKTSHENTSNTSELQSQISVRSENKTPKHVVNKSPEIDKIETISELIDNFSKVSKEISLLSKNSSNVSNANNTSANENYSSKPKPFNLITDNSSIILDTIENLKSSIQEITRSSKNLSSRRFSLKKHESDIETKSLPENENNEAVSTEKVISHNEPDKINENREDLLEKSAVTTVADEELPTDESLIHSVGTLSEENQDIKQVSADVEIELNQISLQINHTTDEAEQEAVSDVSKCESYFDSMKKSQENETEGNVKTDQSFHEISAHICDENNLNIVENLSVHNFKLGKNVETEKNDIADAETISETNSKNTERLDLSYGYIVTKISNEEKEREVAEINEEEMFNGYIATKSINEEKETEVAKSSEDENFIRKNEEINQASGDESVKSESIKSEYSSDSSKDKSSTKSQHIDVKKRVSEILADANMRNDKSPRLQDLYITTYDVISPANSPELGSPAENENNFFSAKLYGNEAEELLKKQLAIEQEIKQLEQQQKEQIPYLFVREIPNKPPPPYTPPITIQSPVVKSLLPMNFEQVQIVTSFAAEHLHESFLNGSLDTVTLVDETLALKSGSCKLDKCAYEFIFDLCKEIAISHYKKFNKETGPIWTQLTKKSKLAATKPLTKMGLEELMNNKLKELLGFEKAEQQESAIIRWSRKKRDHVDEILVLESQNEESEWTDYNRDELFVKNDVTEDIMNMLLNETAKIFEEILAKKGSVMY